MLAFTYEHQSTGSENEQRRGERWTKLGSVTLSPLNCVHCVVV